MESAGIINRRFILSDKRFFERVRNWNKENYSHTSNNGREKIESVVNYLQILLNSRQGTTLMDDKYGMPDFSDFVSKFPGSIRNLEKIISETIEKYETRLSDVEVGFVLQDENSLSLVFEINAALKVENGFKTICLESFMDSSGQMMIKG